MTKSGFATLIAFLITLIILIIIIIRFTSKSNQITEISIDQPQKVQKDIDQIQNKLQENQNRLERDFPAE